MFDEDGWSGDAVVDDDVFDLEDAFGRKDDVTGVGMGVGLGVDVFVGFDDHFA